MTDAQFVAWLKNSASIRCVLVEVAVQVGGVETTRYLSTKGYITSPTDTPANTHYAPGIVGGVKFTETLPLDGTASLSYGDIEIENVASNRDTWFDDVWDNRSIKVFIGDVRWVRSDFRQIFEGIVAGIDTKDRGRINLKITDKIQRLNAPVTENKLGGTTANAERILPLVLGECHNITPLLVDATVNEYQVHDGPIESIIEVRDDGVPVSFTPFLATGKFRTTVQPSGQITASVQGAKPAESLGTELNSEYTCDTMSTWTESVTGVGSIVSGKIRVSSSGVQARLTKRFPTIPGVKYRLSMSITASGATAQSFVNLSGQTSVTATQGYTFGSATAGSSNTVSGDVQATGFETTVILYITGAGAFGDFDNISLKQITGGGYINTAPSLIKHLLLNYGKAVDRLTYSELDSDFFRMEQTLTQPVGLFLSDRTNMIQAITSLADSVGAKPLFTRQGKFTLVRTSNASDSVMGGIVYDMNGAETYSATGWVNNVGTFTYNGDSTATSTASASTSKILNTNSIDGTVYRRIRMRVKRLAGTGWDGKVSYSTDAHSISTSFYALTPTTDLPTGTWKIVEWDMYNLTVGGDDWATSMIRTMRIDLGTTVGDSFAIDWIAIDLAAPTAVTTSDIVQHSLAISQLPPVKAGVKIGYCKNWTVETEIAAGVDIRHADLYKQEWLTITQSDSGTTTQYRTFVEPTQQDTLLLTNADALNEAVRRLNLFNTRRKVFKYTGMPWLMLEKLGAFQTITNSRFGLQSGATGQIVSTSVDWLNPHITVEIFV